MKINISFKKSNPDNLVQDYEVYRSSDKEELYAPENLIGTITDFSDEVVVYTDTSGEFGVGYYYGLKTNAVDGFSTVSAPRFISHVKNAGDIDREVWCGDHNLGYCGMSPTSLIQIQNTLKLKIDTIIQSLSIAGLMSAPSTIVFEPAATGFMSGYYKGMPSHYMPIGACRVYNGGNTGNKTIETSMQAFVDALIDPDEVYDYNGFEYNLRMLDAQEWFDLFLNIDYANSPNKDHAKQPLTPVVMNGVSGVNTKVMILKDSTGALKIYPIINGVNDRQPLASNTILSNQYQMLGLPLALTPVQY